LLRIASGGSGILAPGELHPDLVNRLAIDAAKTAQHVLTMCIRAIDYCPPIDITFGDYLRAIITADVDLVVDDTRDYRIAFIEAFRERGIYPSGINNLSVESLCYETPDYSTLAADITNIKNFLRDFRQKLLYKPEEEASEREYLYKTTRDFIRGGLLQNGIDMLSLHRKITNNFENSSDFERISGLIFKDWEDLGIESTPDNGPRFEIHSLRLASRVGPTGIQKNLVMISLTQKVRVLIKNATSGHPIVTPLPSISSGKQHNNQEASFMLRGSCTLVFDLDGEIQLKYAICKHLLDMDALKKGQRRINTRRALNLHQAYRGKLPESAFEAFFSKKELTPFNEPFSFLHKH
jgi:hypothetical protein